MKEYKEELKVLIDSYWEESDERRKEDKVNINFDNYEQLEEANIGTLIVATEDSILTGFLFVITTPCSHTGKTKNAVEIIMVDPYYRESTIASGLLACLEENAANGSLLTFTLKTEFPHDDLAARAGYRHVENVFMKRCDNGCSNDDSSGGSGSGSCRI